MKKPASTTGRNPIRKENELKSTIAPSPRATHRRLCTKERLMPWFFMVCDRPAFELTTAPRSVGSRPSFRGRACTEKPKHGERVLTIRNADNENGTWKVPAHRARGASPTQDNQKSHWLRNLWHAIGLRPVASP